MTWSRARTATAALLLFASLALGIDGILVFRSIRPPEPVTTFFGDAEWQRTRRVETMAGWGDAFDLGYVNNFAVPVSMATALASLVLAFLGWRARRLDRSICIVSGVWLLVMFVLSFHFGSAYRVGMSRPVGASPAFAGEGEVESVTCG